jgi:hypothetical protein
MGKAPSRSGTASLIAGPTCAQASLPLDQFQPSGRLISSWLRRPQARCFTGLASHCAGTPWYSQRCSQAGRLPSTSADGSSSIAAPIDAGRMLAGNSKTEGRGFESFRPCHFFSRQVATRAVSFPR